jgi:RimK family alpha-L-glutamate ligase
MRGRIAIITDDPGWHGARLRDALAARGYDSEFVSLPACGFDLSGSGPGLSIPGFDKLPDGVFVRGIPGGTLEQVVLCLDLLHAMKHLGICVYNDGQSIERSVDKGMTSFLLHAAGISTPPAWVLRPDQALRQRLQQELQAGNELVIKPLFGSQGTGLARIGHLAELPSPESCAGVYYLQRFISNGEENARDWRVFVIGGKAVAAMSRHGNGWISNVAQGASCHPAVLDKPLRTLAEAAVSALDMNYAGVDILRDPQGKPYVIEVNGIPAWKGLQQVCPIDLAERLVDDFLHRSGLRQRMEVIG